MLSCADEPSPAYEPPSCERGVRRLWGVACRGIARLENAAGESVTLNVEYNQLDPLLRATGHPDGDANLPSTGHSPFPGNINQVSMNEPASDHPRATTPQMHKKA